MTRGLVILGTRGIPASHGGFETFAENLSVYMADKSYHVIVYCQSNESTKAIKTDQWQGVKRVHIAPYFNGQIINGALGTILFDFRSIIHAIKHERKSVWLTLGYNTAFLNILPLLFKIPQIFNMDGIEWKRDKWSRAAKAFLYLNYLIAGWIGRTLIADHPEIEKILQHDFKDKAITMIPYGSNKIETADQQIILDYHLQPQKYLLVIARIEPENNILPIVKAWSTKPRGLKLVIVGNYLGGTNYQKQVKSSASKDVIFTGSLYDKKTIEALRFYCKAYLHGHSVGGTNPTLVESLGAGSAIIAHNNPFNRWVAGNAAIYFSNEENLKQIFDLIDKNQIDLTTLSQKASEQHQEYFQWLSVLQAYEKLIESHF